MPDPSKGRAGHEAARGKKIGVKSLSELTKLELAAGDLREILTRINKESDRGAAIMCAGLIESLLMELLNLILVNKDERSALFDDKGAPLGTLSNKTIAAYAFGLINSQQKTEIDQIRQVRNAFSHAVRPIDFNTPPIANVSRKLTRQADAYPKDGYLPWRESSSKYLFLMAAAGLAQELSDQLVEMASTRMESLRVQFERAMTDSTKGSE